MIETPNARFWTFQNDSYVKLTLAPGETLNWYAWARHEEGWASEAESWHHTGDGIEREITTDGRDCDGRLQGLADMFAPLNALRARSSDIGSGPAIHDGRPVRLPEWGEVRSSHIDEYAELAGY